MILIYICILGRYMIILRYTQQLFSSDCLVFKHGNGFKHTENDLPGGAYLMKSSFCWWNSPFCWWKKENSLPVFQFSIDKSRCLLVYPWLPHICLTFFLWPGPFLLQVVEIPELVTEVTEIATEESEDVPVEVPVEPAVEVGGLWAVEVGYGDGSDGSMVSIFSIEGQWATSKVFGSFERNLKKIHDLKMS